MTPQRARPSLVAATAVALAAAGAFLLAPRAARADCVLVGSTVTCTGLDQDGFTAPVAVDDLEVNLEPGAQVRNDDADPAALLLNDGNTVNLGQSSALGNSGIANTDGILAGSDNIITLGPGAGILTSAPGMNTSRGIVVDDDNTIDIGPGSTVTSALSSPTSPIDTAIAIDADGGNTITNQGVVGVGVLGTISGTAIRFGAGAGAGGGSGNTVTNAGGIGAISGGIGIDFSASGVGMPNTVTNTVGGVINVDGTAILGSDGVENVSNLGRILGAIELAGGNDTLVNDGVIAGDIDLGAGDDVLTQSSFGGSPGVLTGGSGTDTVTFTGPDLGTLGIVALGPGSLTELETLGFDGGLWGLLGTSDADLATTELASGTLFAVGRVGLQGDYTQRSGSTLTVRLLGQNQSDGLDVAGTATIEAGAQLEVRVEGAFDETAQFTVVEGAGGLVSDPVAPFQFVAPQISAVFSVDQFVVGNAIMLRVARSAFGPIASTPNQSATAFHLDSIVQAGATGDLQDVIDELSVLSAQQLQASLDEIHPEALDAHTGTMIAWGRQFASAALERRPDCEPVPWRFDPRVRSLAACSAPGWVPWVTPLGNVGERDGSEGHIDYDVVGTGVALGVDRHLGDGWIATGYLGGGGADLDGSFGDGRFYSLELGGALAWERDGWTARGAVAYGHGWHETRRRIDFVARTARSDFESNRVTAALEAGRAFPWRALRVEPVVGADWTGIWEDAFDESGAGSLDLDVDARDYHVLSTTAGVRLSATGLKHGYIVNWLEWADGVWRPELTLRWRGIWTGTERDYDARIAAAPAGVGGFTAEGEDAEHAADIQARVLFQPEGTDIQVGAFYDGLHGDGTHNHFFGAEVRIPLP